MSKFGFDVEAVRLTLVTPTSVVEHPEIADTTLDYALRYADLGWYVIPVRPDKKPLDGYGLNSATKDPAVIRNIWGQNPQAGIAIACERSGLVVLDVDPRNGGRETLARLEAERGVIYSAIASVTQSGGEHRVFKAEPGAVYPGTLGPGLDVKHRGYVLVEPSRGQAGAYAWQGDKNPLKGALPTDAPRLMYGAPRQAEERSLTVKTRPGSVIEAPQFYADLRAALSVISPECEYPQWLRVLQGLSRLSDREAAYELAREWSTGSAKPGHTEAAFKDKWRSLMREDSEVNPRTVFYLATQADPGWSDKPPALLSPEHPLSFKNALPSGAGVVTAFEYVYDRFMSTGVNVVAGAPGVGKTTLVVPLALAAAHLCPHDHPLKPRVRRNVIIVTESVVQVQRVIYSLATWGHTGLPPEEFDRHVRVIPALRLDPKVVAGVAEHYAGWTVDNAKADGTQHAALPLVVLDTANAVLELENENDNAEVGRAMALIKQAFAAFPLIIVAHTSKVMGMGETDGLSPRGASAWTGDAQGVYTVFKDGEHPVAPRVLKATKVRFPPAYPELMFELVSHREAHPNVLGEMEDEWFSHSVARPLKAGERTQLKEDNKELRLQDEWVVLCDEMLELVRTQPEHSRSYYEQLPKTKGGPRGSQERKERAVASLLADGCLKIVLLDKPRGRSDHYLRVDEEVVAAVNKGRYAV
jgi:hypothetical protein